MGDEVTFAAKFRDWIAIKKMSANETTKPEEVAALLASITATIDRKSFEFAGVNTELIDAYVDSLTKGKRKAYGVLAEILSNLKPGELKARFIEASDEKKYPLAESYFMRKLLSNLGFSAWVDVENMQKAYPELKIPKPRGRMPGKKKKA